MAEGANEPSIPSRWNLDVEICSRLNFPRRGEEGLDAP